MPTARVDRRGNVPQEAQKKRFICVLKILISVSIPTYLSELHVLSSGFDISLLRETEKYHFPDAVQLLRPFPIVPLA